jgi:uncharacterized protein YjbI with pentapeptide repeats
MLSLSGGPLGAVTAACSGALDMAGNPGSASVRYWVDTSLSSFKQSKGVYNLQNANLSGGHLDFLDLTGAGGKNANFSGASFIDTNLSDADLGQANLRNADLQGARLSGASLKGANLTGADLGGVDLTGADLSQATLKGATGLGTATLTGVTWKQTTCPDGTTSNNDGGTCLNHLTP